MIDLYTSESSSTSSADRPPAADGTKHSDAFSSWAHPEDVSLRRSEVRDDLSGQQQAVDGYFTRASNQWDALYTQDDLLGDIYRRRQEVALRLLEALHL